MLAPLPATLRFLALTLLLWPALSAAAGEPATARRYMISAANPHASEAGLAMLRKGGSAVDAAIAAQAVLSLVEPQSSGIGGGGFLMHFDAETKQTQAWDGRETAPAGLDPKLFLNQAGERLGYIEAALGGAAVGTPGIVKMLAEAHAAHGKLDWADLFEPAIKLAQAGFEISPRLAFLLDRRVKQQTNWALPEGALSAASDYFFRRTADGTLQAKPVGTLLKNPAYAETLKLIAANGASGFYEGPVAQAMVDAVRNARMRPGFLTLEDLKAYAPVVRTPVCGPYRAQRVCSMGPPSSGATTMLAILGMLERFDMAAAGLDDGVPSAQAIHYFAEASRLAYADRDLYVADPAFVSVPTKGLIDPGYLDTRSRLIDSGKAAESVEPGSPPVQDEARVNRAAHAGPDYPSTSHLSVVDGDGNVVSFTTTVQIAFGSFVMTGGFLLNNQLTDFSFLLEDEAGKPIANRPEPGKRPRSSMTPTLVFDEKGAFRLAVGSPGGSRIISYVAKTIVGVLDFGLDMQKAIELPHTVKRYDTLELEADTPVLQMQATLEDKFGHQVTPRTLNSGLHGISVGADAVGRLYFGGADPRREGVALGD